MAALEFGAISCCAVPGELVASMTILIVEDDKPLRETFADILQQVGYRVTAAENGREALARIRVERPAFIFIDLVMPIMSGFELIEALRADSDLSTIPLVAVTASAETAPPGTLFMKKPFRAEAAVGLIEMHTAKRRVNCTNRSEESKLHPPIHRRAAPGLQRKCRESPRRSRRAAPND
jgi:CheY-like chemotaxis protein